MQEEDTWSHVAEFKRAAAKICVANLRKMPKPLFIFEFAYSRGWTLTKRTVMIWRNVLSWSDETYCHDLTKRTVMIWRNVLSWSDETYCHDLMEALTINSQWWWVSSSKRVILIDYILMIMSKASRLYFRVCVEECKVLWGEWMVYSFVSAPEYVSCPLVALSERVILIGHLVLPATKASTAVDRLLLE